MSMSDGNVATVQFPASVCTVVTYFIVDMDAWVEHWKYRVRRKDLPIEKIVLLKNGKTYRLQNFKVYVEMYSNRNYMHKLGYFRPRHT